MEKVRAYKNAKKLKEIQEDLIRFEDLYVPIEDLNKIYNYLLQNLPCDKELLGYEYFIQYLEF